MRFSRNRPPLALCTLACVLVLFASCSGLRANGASSTTTDSLDALERTLELSHHEQLAEIKADPDHELNEFTTDGCSGGLSVGWAYLAENIDELQAVHGSHPPWESCCVSHDEQYHVAGARKATPEKSFNARKVADLELRSCVLETGLKRSPELSAEYDLAEDDIAIIYTAIANLMYRAVRIGGIPCSTLPWRWGYGWPKCK